MLKIILIHSQLEIFLYKIIYHNKEEIYKENRKLTQKRNVRIVLNQKETQIKIKMQI